jgi:5'-3' exonuclease
MSVLLIDGDNLLTIGFYGFKNCFYKGKHIGAIFHFLNTIRRAIEDYHLDKVVVFWDGDDCQMTRKKIYHQYKENRRKRLRTDEEISSYNYQRTRVKQYLEELYVRQGEFPYCETDDSIAFYTQNVKNEDVIIYSSDGDLVQLISERVKLYNPSLRRIVNNGELILYDKEEILVDNLKIAKIICGDKSDNIYGIRGFGIKKMINFFPEIKTKKISVAEVIEKSNQIFEQDKNNKTIANLLTGVTKEGVLGDEFFIVNETIVSLDKPFLTEEAKSDILSLINEDLDPEGRSYKNTMKMMMEDGLFNVLPKSDGVWVNFLNPFLRLTRKEKNKRKIKIKNHE